jgi:hypothetical protein
MAIFAVAKHPLSPIRAFKNDLLFKKRLCYTCIYGIITNTSAPKNPARRAGYIFARPAAERTGVGRDLAYFTPSLGGNVATGAANPKLATYFLPNSVAIGAGTSGVAVRAF